MPNTTNRTMNTPTPMTDTLFNEIEPEFCDMSAWDYFCEMTALATELERDLTAAREEIERLQCAGIHSCSDTCQRPNCVLRRENKILTEQRDRLDDQLDHILLRLGRTQERMIDAERQRDRLAEALRKIKNAGGGYDDPYDELDFIDGVTFEALQSLNQPTEQ